MGLDTGFGNGEILRDDLEEIEKRKAEYSKIILSNKMMTYFIFGFGMMKLERKR